MPVTIVGNNTPTAGGVVYGDGTNYASTAAGTSGQVLQSNGSSAPSWATPSTGALVFITSATASNSATVDLENAMSAYGVYMIVANQIITTSGTNPTFNVRLKVGGAYQTGASYSYQSLVPPVATLSSSSGTFLQLTPALAAGEAVSFVMYVYSPSNTTNTKIVTWHGGWSWTGSGAPALFSGAGGYFGSASAITGVRFYTSTDNLVSGTFRLYGISNS